MTKEQDFAASANRFRETALQALTAAARTANPSLTREQAAAQVLRQHPDLYAGPLAVTALQNAASTAGGRFADWGDVERLAKRMVADKAYPTVAAAVTALLKQDASARALYDEQVRMKGRAR